jgi:hypothetical protein
MLAHGIPGARFVALESRNHVVLSHEPAWQRFVDEVCEFLGGETSARPQPLPPSGSERA